jgi:hypothetical protein
LGDTFLILWRAEARFTTTIGACGSVKTTFRTVDSEETEDTDAPLLCLFAAIKLAMDEVLEMLVLVRVFPRESMSVLVVFSIRAFTCRMSSEQFPAWTEREASKVSAILVSSMMGTQREDSISSV